MAKSNLKVGSGSFCNLSQIDYQNVERLPNHVLFSPSNSFSLVRSDSISEDLNCRIQDGVLSPPQRHRPNLSPRDITTMAADSSCGNIGPTSPDPGAMARKSSTKPLAEKRRRQRINQSVDHLKNMILESLGKDPTQYAKLEKADILEMTVRYVQGFQRQQLACLEDSASKYKAGFSQCTAEIEEYLEKFDNLPSDLPRRVADHLRQKIEHIRIDSEKLEGSKSPQNSYVKIAPAVQPVLLLLNPISTATVTPVHTMQVVQNNVQPPPIQDTSEHRCEHLQDDPIVQYSCDTPKKNDSYVSSSLNEDSWNNKNDFQNLYDDQVQINDSVSYEDRVSNERDRMSVSPDPVRTEQYGTNEFSNRTDDFSPSYEESFNQASIDEINHRDSIYENDNNSHYFHPRDSISRSRRDSRSVIAYASKSSSVSRSRCSSVSKASADNPKQQNSHKAQVVSSSKINTKSFRSRLSSKSVERQLQNVPYLPPLQPPREDLQDSSSMWRPWH